MPAPYSDPAGAAHHAGALADLVADALELEVRTTPKPGLVDLRNTGAHHDMDVSTFLASAAALRPLLGDFFTAGAASAHLPSKDVLEVLRPIGQACEHAMFAATNGVNTHKGSIFAFGLLLGAAGRVWARTGRLKRNHICAEVAAICDGLVERELQRPGEARTAGERLFRAHGLTGARGEAASGFATVLGGSLPVLERILAEGRGRDTALQAALLHLLAANDDTNIASRGCIEGLAWAKTQARRLIEAGGADLPDFIARLEALDDAFIERNLSPGGSGDLLAMTWTLHCLRSA
uniref:Probable 2-(5''-triphosphoribosyl)-3'-dephosphocoenzyme-A synthase n=1 Tax=Rhodopseudomonas palustris (strain BisA53) TaxID=316055 RepID=Q07L20_RHOP5